MNVKMAYISSMLIFGSIGLFVKNIDMSSMELAFARAVIASIFLGAVTLLRRQKVSFATIKSNLVLLAISGAAIGLNWFFLFQAFKYTTIPYATLSYYFAPVFIMLLSPIVLKEKLTGTKISCVVMAMMGLFLILNVGGDSAGGSYDHPRGIMFGLLGAVAYASVTLMNKFIKALSGFETTFIQLMMAALVLLLSILFSGNLSIFSVEHKDWILIFVVGIVHTGIAFWLYFSSVKNLTAHSIAVLSYIDPISAIIIASIFLGESMTAVQVLGGVLILGSTFLSEKADTYMRKQNAVK